MIRLVLAIHPISSSDTKLTGKSLVPEITSRAELLHKSSQGRRAIMYLLVPRVSRHFTPAQRAILEETDSIRAKTSKKDDNLRRGEILRAASPALVELLEEKGRTERMLRDPGGSLVVTEIMLFAEGGTWFAMFKRFRRTWFLSLI